MESEMVPSLNEINLPEDDLISEENDTITPNRPKIIIMENKATSKVTLNNLGITNSKQPTSSAFFTTRWTLVTKAKGDAPEARTAMSELCEAYWMPVFKFLRYEGRSEDDSNELTQEFLTTLLSGGGIDGASRIKGRFRSYLLGALKHFLSDRRRAEGRQKRGGDITHQSIESSGSETSPSIEIADPSGPAPDSYFDHQWALAVMARGLETVREDFEKSGKLDQFDTLKPWLSGDSESLSQTEIALELGMTTGALKVAIHRLRKKFGDSIRNEISQTVTDPEEVAEELNYLIEILS